MIETVCFLSRHPITSQQRKDFVGYKVVQVRSRALTYQDLYFDVVMEVGYAPDVIVATVRWAWQKGFVRHVQKMSPRTLVVRAVTEADNLSPTGLYMQYLYEYGKGLRFAEYLPPRVVLERQRRLEEQ